MMVLCVCAYVCAGVCVCVCLCLCVSVPVCCCVCGRAAHQLGMTFRGIQVDKVLFTGHNRLRIGSAGVRDLLESDSQIPLTELQVRGLLRACS